uniref:Major facilitator superfamily transporter n=1 Tax=Loa loa TaxID=7209 RepID=A0A1I7VAR2_LOALO
MGRNEERDGEETMNVTSDICRQVETTGISNELTGCQVFGYGIGHFYNDLCASMWFTYFLLFLEKVIVMRSSVAGLIMLIGQATDALSTAFIGVLNDSTSAPLCFRRCGQRKSWHAFGTLLVTSSFAFIYNKCFICGYSTTDWGLFVWYAPYVIVFQIGWAAVQISHLALLPELTCDESRRTTMNSVRYGFTVVANLVIFAALSVMLYFDDKGSAVGPMDLRHFSTMSGIVIILGLFTQIVFYAATKEPSRIGHVIVSAQSRYQSGILRSFKLSFLKWMCRFQFYQVGMLYVLCRLYINMSQVYFPFYITHLPNLSKMYVAMLPMVSYCSSLLISSLTGLSFINRRCNLESLALLGCFCGILSCLVILFDTYFPVHVTAFLLGVAQAILLITSLSAVAKLIRQNTESGAFVYGIFSSMDKISNGLVLQMIELFSPSCFTTSKSAVHCTSFYRMVVVVVPSTCLLIAFFVLLSLVISEKWRSRNLSVGAI